jgi:uncharacterized protein
MKWDNIKTIAVVGLSNKSESVSNKVGEYLKNQGYRIIPVNPTIEEALDEKAYPDLLSIPENVQVDVVNIFRRPENAPPVVDEAIQRRVPTIWFQEGTVNEEAAVKAEHEGLEVVMDKCMKKEHCKYVADHVLKA